MDENHLEPFVKLLIVVLVLLFNLLYYVLTLLKKRQRRRDAGEPAPQKRGPLQELAELVGRFGERGQDSLEPEEQEPAIDAESYVLPLIEEEPVVPILQAAPPRAPEIPRAPRAIPPAPPPPSPEEGPSLGQEDIVEAILLGAILRRRDPAAARR